jgi:hypothetical protein
MARPGARETGIENIGHHVSRIAYIDFMPRAVMSFLSAALHGVAMTRTSRRSNEAAARYGASVHIKEI